MEATNDIPLHSVSRETLSYEANSTSHSDDSETPPYEATNEDTLPPYQRTNPVRSRSAPLRRNIFFLLPIAAYTCMAAYSWVTLCILSRTEDMVTNRHNSKVTQYRAARVLQTITGVATVPTISLVCAWAAAVYVQNQPNAHSLRLRQVITLADRGWMDPRIWFRLVFYPSGFKRYGSALLVLAILMHIIGATTYPILSLFLSHRLVYVGPYDIDFSYDIEEVGSIPLFLHEGFVPGPIFTLRNELQTSGINGFQSQLWGDNGVLSEINSTTNWFAQLPSNFTTGPYPDQYIPRVNSSVSIRNMTAGEFPSNCSDTTDWFYSFYRYPGGRMNLTVEVCVPINGTQSPWKNTDGRQDFSEVLYVNATAHDTDTGYASYITVTPFVVIMNTTAGVFRLPDYMTNQTPGPLEANSSLCLSYTYGCDGGKSRRQYNLDYFEPALPGPLTLIALAIFGPGSFADTQQNATGNGNSDYKIDTGWKQYFDGISEGDPLPLIDLGVASDTGGTIPIETWIMSLTDSQNLASTTSAFTQASFLAIKAIFDAYFGGEITVRYSSSALEQISLPSMSLGGLIAGSVLLVLYIIPLLCLAVYSAASCRWTHTLDAFTMLRMGAAFGQEHLPFLIGTSMRKILALDDLPGVVRDISLPDDKIGQLALGVGGAPLQLKKPYLAYPGNHYHVP
ncbi:hypothetical protein PISL3812_00873 [Talaromyces islandicus]|uniref:Uncharacterized protein n=1 Tax=Talaromyces islandicus TaxID=28573 RepID=A0A0U1LN17_TALIS|nr:hypothetical protein PISL3812_00873 [Talaromyces islandicus]